MVKKVEIINPDINEMAYSMGYEEIGEIEVPKRADYIRSIILELARIQAHIFSIGGNSAAIGLYSAMYLGVLQRDYILDLFEEITGGRVYHIYIRPGGVRHDINDETFEKILDLLDNLENESMPEFQKLIFESPLAQKRWKNTAILKRLMELIAKRKAGRPKGSLNKPKGTPVTVAAEVVVEEAVEAEVEEEEAEEEEELEEVVEEAPPPKKRIPPPAPKPKAKVPAKVAKRRAPPPPVESETESEEEPPTPKKRKKRKKHRPPSSSSSGEDALPPEPPHAPVHFSQIYENLYAHLNR
jgi:hypothetical protein